MCDRWFLPLEGGGGGERANPLTPRDGGGELITI